MDYTKWSPKELAQQLKNLGFEAYARNFRINDLKGSHLPFLTEEHLKEMGITKIGHRILLMKRIKQIINGENPTPVHLSGAPANHDSRPSSTYSSSPSTPQETEHNIPQRVMQRRQQQEQQQTQQSEEESSNQYDLRQSVHSKLRYLSQKQPEEDNTAQLSSRSRNSRIQPAPEKETFSTAASNSSDAGQTEGDGKVTCQYCGRRLAPDAARRHIPVCAKIRGKLMKK